MSSSRSPAFASAAASVCAAALVSYSATPFSNSSSFAATRRSISRICSSRRSIECSAISPACFACSSRSTFSRPRLSSSTRSVVICRAESSAASRSTRSASCFSRAARCSRSFVSWRAAASASLSSSLTALAAANFVTKSASACAPSAMTCSSRCDCFKSLMRSSAAAVELDTVPMIPIPRAACDCEEFSVTNSGGGPSTLPTKSPAEWSGERSTASMLPSTSSAARSAAFAWL